MTSDRTYDTIIVGGGFFGAVIAARLRERGRKRVVVLEKEAELLTRASYRNQARIHNGYHYPRNIVTAFRSRVNFPRFVEEFHECVDDSFEKVYAIAKTHSKVTSVQFRDFCVRIGAPIEPAPARIRDRFDPTYIEEVFLCQEYALDAAKLRGLMWRRLQDTGVEVRTSTEVKCLEKDGGGISVRITGPGVSERISAPQVIVCTYSMINGLLRASGLPEIPMKHEATELALVGVPESMRNLGVTVMCGPFFSCMPFPAENLHTLSHVRHTPHCAWTDGDGIDAHSRMSRLDLHTSFMHMKKDAERYLPELASLTYRGSLWEVKTVLPMNENDDGRPILFRSDHGLKGLTCVMGGKLDNVYDALEEIDKERERDKVI
ncbi:hypothetical protein AMJ57_00250 [Parcubacteria bacterium SG8_24]|nr:MAG: hypothetical protein AMJ57_00250 [Parcubacteria bacterium SG8_24]